MREGESIKGKRGGRRGREEKKETPRKERGPPLIREAPAKSRARETRVCNLRARVSALFFNCVAPLPTRWILQITNLIHRCSPNASNYCSLPRASEKLARERRFEFIADNKDPPFRSTTFLRRETMLCVVPARDYSPPPPFLRPSFSSPFLCLSCCRRAAPFHLSLSLDETFYLRASGAH